MGKRDLIVTPSAIYSIQRCRSRAVLKYLNNLGVTVCLFKNELGAVPRIRWS